MLKQIYVRVAQALPVILPGGEHFYRKSSTRGPGATWFASLGAIYHLDRMIALDIPWWNVQSAKVIADFLRIHPGARVFEYGSGASTVWLARRALSVTTVEHDPHWSTGLAERLRPYPHVQLVAAGYSHEEPPEDSAYVSSIDGTGQYDLIVIDGRLRAHCLARAIQHLQPDGMILFDDSGRKRYRPAIEESGLTERHFCGLSYCVPYPDHTSILTARSWPLPKAA